MRQTKRILLINAVSWSDDYPGNHPLQNVAHWYTSHFEGVEDVMFCEVHAEEKPLAAARGDVQAVILTGSARNAWDEGPINGRLTEVILHCYNKHLPFLGVCYGYQLLARALGGEVGRHSEGVQFGTFTIELTRKGKESALFTGFPDQFEVIQSHQDAVINLPVGADLLATSQHTAHQAFQYGDSMMGVQFHPESNPTIMRFVWAPRRNKWRGKLNFDLDQRLNTMKPTPLASEILRNFVNFLIE